MTVALLGLCLTAGTSVAFEGTWQGKGPMPVAATISKEAEGYSVKLETATKGCGGEVEGKATVEANMLTLSVPNEDATFGEACIVTLTKKGKRLVMEEREGCLFWHGASCEFSGTMSKKK